ncbi:hypothetical protein Vadar_020868 [Vaccinium darrowii]|uniref:Uncharacterized protein n=1 Tax=Vaccinium darrowii TaxID=229202 RepID=A0ACB7X2C7_9ERIC|nr:hypothetical protein Vadar_020868 [Vaccinium darrowii]
MAPLKEKKQTYNSHVPSFPSSTHKLSLQKTPLLILLPNEKQEEETHKDYSVSFLNLEAKRIHRTKNAFTQRLRNSRCVGSSHGWLVLLDGWANPCLFNPISCHRISLPPKETLPHVISVTGSAEYGFDIEYILGVRKSRVSRSVTAKEIQECLILKAILSSDPSHGNDKDYVVMAIYGCEAKVAFCKRGDSVWTDLEGKSGPYCDIICHKNQLFALSEISSVESWDFSTPLLVKTMDFHPFYIFPKRVTETALLYNDRNRFSSQCYLVESCGDCLLVKRHIGEFVSDEGEAVCEADLLSDKCSHPLVYPYKTLEFTVYRLNIIQRTWEEVESLGDRALFVGGNHSMSLSTTAAQYPSSHCQRNSIYFTDDYWVRMNEDYSYGGHDMGVFCLDDKSVKPLKNLNLPQRVDPPPFWLVPNM